MSTDYNVGVYLNPVPTGFGSYTGISIFNRSDKPVSYVAEMSETSLFTTNNDPLPDTDAVDDNLYDTLFVASDINNVDTSISSVSLSLGAGESGNIYVAHKPFSTFWPTYQTTGIETANLSIISQSSEGDSDSQINIKITGQRVISSIIPDRPGNFYARESYNEENGYNLNFNWEILSGNPFISGFRIDLCSDDAFSTDVADSPYYVQIPKNSETSKPEYLDYYNYGTRSFSYKINGLPTDVDLYARIRSINGLNDLSSYSTYCTGFQPNNENPIDSITYNGLHQEPGDNLGFATNLLRINKSIEEEYEIDLAKILYEENNNSYDFSFYTGVVINFYSSNLGDNSYGKILSRKKDVAAIRLKKPDGYNFTYSVDSNNKFNLTLNFQNVFVAGYNDEGSKWNGIEVSDPGNGGPVFDFDNLDYDEKSFDYYINKDKDSIFYAGLAGMSAYIQKEKGNFQAYVDGKINKKKEESLYDYNLVPHQDPLSAQEISEGKSREYKPAGIDGKLIKNNISSEFPNVYLAFSDRSSASFLPSSEFLFRFTSEEISSSQNAGHATNIWNSSAGRSGVYFKNNSSNVLTVREAYGKKFYELSGGAGQTNAIQAFEDINGSPTGPAFYGLNNKADIRPNYTILVFALARKDLKNNSYAETVHEMLTNCNAIHKFVDATAWGTASEDDAMGFWKKRSAPFNPNDLIYNFYRDTSYGAYSSKTASNIYSKSSFVGSCLNSPALLVPFSYSEIYDKQKFTTNDRDFFVYSNKNDISDDNLWRDQIKFYPVRGSRVSTNHFVFKGFNLAKTSSFEAADNQKFTILQDSSGSGVYDELSAFELFFVKMHSTVGKYNTNLWDSNLPARGLYNQTFINGKEVFNQILALQQDLLVRRMNIQLNNNDGDTNDNTRTRLYLLDYIYGAASDVNKRNQSSDSVMEYLVSHYAPLMLKSSENKLHIAKNDSGVNSQLSFGLPLSHNFLNLYST